MVHAVVYLGETGVWVTVGAMEIPCRKCDLCRLLDC